MLCTCRLLQAAAMSDARTQGRRTSQSSLPRSRSLSSLVQEQAQALKRGDRKREGDPAVPEDSKRFKEGDDLRLQEQRTLSFNIPRSEFAKVMTVFLHIESHYEFVFIVNDARSSMLEAHNAPLVQT